GAAILVERFHPRLAIPPEHHAPKWNRFGDHMMRLFLEFEHDVFEKVVATFSHHAPAAFCSHGVELKQRGSRAADLALRERQNRIVEIEFMLSTPRPGMTNQGVWRRISIDRVRWDDRSREPDDETRNRLSKLHERHSGTLG